MANTGLNFNINKVITSKNNNYIVYSNSLDLELFDNDEYEDIDYSVDLNKQAQDYVSINGDINYDGKITVKDKSLLEQYLKSGLSTSAFDVNGDGASDNLDIEVLGRYLVEDESLYTYFNPVELRHFKNVINPSETQEMLGPINKRIEELEKEIQKLIQSQQYTEYAMNYKGGIPNAPADIHQRWEKQYSDHQEKLNEFQQELSFLNSMKQRIDISAKMYDFEKISISNEYKAYFKKHKNDEITIAFTYGMAPDELDPYELDCRKYMTQEQKVMYQYLLDKEGRNTAGGESARYLQAIKDNINQVKGADEAEKFILNLDLDDEGKVKENLKNIFCTGGQGLGDGVSNFFTGLKNIIDNGNVITADEYKNMIILQYLSENADILDDVYKGSSSLGNIIPAMVTSAVISYLATPAAGAESAATLASLTASTLMGMSAGGISRHQSLTQGNDVLSATLYGLFSGASEATLGYFLGKIPGISKVSGLTLGNLLSEGAEEYIQEWIDAGLQAVILGENIDLDKVSAQAVESFVMGVCMAGFLNGGQKIVNVTINGIKYNVDVEEIISYMKNNPDVSAYEAAWEENYDKQEIFLLQNNTLLEKNIEEKLNIKCKVIKYNELSIKKLSINSQKNE